jgi:hypothetical protein
MDAFSISHYIALASPFFHVTPCYKAQVADFHVMFDAKWLKIEITAAFDIRDINEQVHKPLFFLATSLIYTEIRAYWHSSLFGSIPRYRRIILDLLIKNESLQCTNLFLFFILYLCSMNGEALLSCKA